MPETDNDIDLNNINEPIYKDKIDESGGNYIKHCISQSSEYMISGSNNDIDYKKYFNTRLEGETKGDLTIIKPDKTYDRTKNTDASRILKEDWELKYNAEKNLFIDSIVASIIIKHKYEHNKKHSLIECKNVLDTINGCYCVFPFIEIDEASSDVTTKTETKYNVTLPNKIKLPNNDISNISVTTIKKMFDKQDLKDDDDFIEKKAITINNDTTYSSLVTEIQTMDFINSCSDYNEINGINFIDGINNLIDHEIYKQFIYILNNKVDNKFKKYIKTEDDITSDEDGVFNKEWVETTLGNYDSKLNPLQIIPKPTRTNIKNLGNEIQKHIQNMIDNLYSKIPNVNKTKTYFVYKKMIINSIYFTKDTYRIDTTNTMSGNDINTNYDNNYIILANIDDLKDIDLYVDNVISLDHFNESGKKPYYHFVIDVKIPICNTSPIRNNLTDTLLNKNLIVIAISLLISILIHALISCCLEFWLKYGSGTNCIYVTNTCSNIGDKTIKNISLIDYYFRQRLTNFPYQNCAKTLESQAGGSGGSDKSGVNVKEFNYPILNKGEGRLCILEDSYSTYSTDRPFPYNIIDYGEKNFDSESIKYFFRLIVIVILYVLIPYRYIYNKCFNKISHIYDKYISRNKLLSSILFVTLPLGIPLIFVLVSVSLVCSMFLIIIYLTISMIHNILMLFNALRFSDKLSEFLLIGAGTICTLTTIILIIASVIQPRRINVQPTDDGSYENTDKGMIFEDYFSKSTIEKFIILCVLITLAVFFYSVNSAINPGKDSMKNERVYNDSMKKWYNMLLYPFDYDNLNNVQKQDFGNYRIDKEVDRNGVTYKPLKDFLTTASSKFSVRKLLFILLVLVVVFYISENVQKNDKGKHNSKFIGIGIFVMFLNIWLLSKSLLNNYLITCKQKKKSFKPVSSTIFGFELPITKRIMLLFTFLAFGVCSVTDKNGSNELSNDFKQILDNKKDKDSINSLNYLSKNIIDLSELLLLLKKSLYLICVVIITLLTCTTLPAVMGITVLYIIFELLYIFFIIPFTKGGHFIFKIMKNRYKILTYMLCTGLILYIHKRLIFGDNTNTVVYTMSAILAIIVIYNFVNE